MCPLFTARKDRNPGHPGYSIFDSALYRSLDAKWPAAALQDFKTSTCESKNALNTIHFFLTATVLETVAFNL